MSNEYHFYGALPSYYSAKARAYLQVKCLPYIDHGASSEIYRDVIVPKTGKSFIPVVVTPEGDALQDTCDIIDALERRHPERPILPSDALLRFASLLMEYYADECLIYPGLHMRWHYEENREWVIPEFARSTDPTSPDALEQMTRFAGRIQMFAAAIGMGDPQGRTACRGVFDRLMAQLNTHFTTSPFLLGPTPSLGDIALMGPLFGHFYRDLHSSHLMRRDAPFVCMWVERMCYGNAAPVGTDWRLDASAIAVCSEIGAGFASFTRDTQAALDRAMTSLGDGTQLPRIIAESVDTTILGLPVHLRVINSYWAYKQQRVRDAYQAVPAADRSRVDRFVADIGCAGLFETPAAWRVKKNAEGWLEVCV